MIFFMETVRESPLKPLRSSDSMVIPYMNNRLGLPEKLVRPNDILVGHGDGCGMILKLARMGIRFDKAILVSSTASSLDRISWTHPCSHTHIFHDPCDELLLLKSAFGLCGRQGVDGYIGPQDPSKITNHKMNTGFLMRRSGSVIRAHLEEIRSCLDTTNSRL